MSATAATTSTDWVVAYAGAVPPEAIAAVAGLMLVQRFARRLGMWPYALLSLPGTLAHELAHYLVALLLGGSPRLPSLWPQRTERGWRLGSVAFRPSPWRTMPVALAPLLLLPLGLAWLVHGVAPAQGAAFWLHAWLAATILSASLPSPTDLRLAAPALLVLLVAATALLALRLIMG